MYVCDDPAFAVRLEPLRLDVRVDYSELSRPIRADCGVSTLAPTLHAVRPVDIRMHQLERTLDVVCVERLVRAAEKPFLLRQPPRSATFTSALPRFSPRSIPMN